MKSRLKFWLAIIAVFLTIQPIVEADCVAGNCYHGHGVFVFDDGGRYEGYWQYGQMHGKGKYILNNHTLIGVWHYSRLETVIETKTAKKKVVKTVVPERIIGCVFGNCEDGYGTRAYKDGLYVGFWRDGKRFGGGEFYWEAGDTYSGEWLDDKPNGYGFIQTRTGDRFSGQWIMGRKSGKGTFWKADGTVLIGQWKDDRLIALESLTKDSDREGTETIRAENALILLRESIERWFYEIDAKLNVIMLDQEQLFYEKNTSSNPKPSDKVPSK